MFKDQVGMIDWSFKDRIFTESLTEMEFNQWVSRHIKDEPLKIVKTDLEQGLLYVGLLFKSPPGRILYKSWRGEQTSIPSYQSFKKMSLTDRQQ